MLPDNSPRIRALRMFMTMDATVLALLGAAFMVSPGSVAKAFHFTTFPQAADFVIGMWGCALLTLGIGYFAAAADPPKHRLWVCIGIARGASEALFGWSCVARGIITWEQGGLGILLAAMMAIAYLVLYPRRNSLP